MRCFKKGANIHISTYSFSYLGHVGRHNHLLLGLRISTGDIHEITPFLASQRVPASNPHALVYALSSQAGQ